MSANSDEMSPKQCVYCGEPLPFSRAGVNAWRVGNQFFCNEFCADGLKDEAQLEGASDE